MSKKLCPHCGKELPAVIRKKRQHTINFNYETAKFEGINGEIEVWKSKFPAIDVEIELRRAEAWCFSHSANRKSDWNAFLGKWLMRAQDKAPTVESLPIHGQVSEKSKNELRESLRNENNKTMPSEMSIGAKKLFFSIGKKWAVLQSMELRGENIFVVKESQDHKTIASGEQP